MALVRITTSTDSTYLVDPSPTIPDHVRVASGGHLRLQWVDEDGATICTSPIDAMAAWSVNDTTSTPV